MTRKAGGVVGPLRPPLRLRVLVEVCVALDGGHPRLEVRTVLETVERLEPAFERVLHKVLGIIGIVGELHRLAVQRVDRGHGELLESRSRLRRGLVRLLFVGHAHYCMQDVR